MKRDWSLLGDIFNAIEDDSLDALADERTQKAEAFNDSSYDDFMRHLEMLVDAELVKGVDVRCGSGRFFLKTDNPRITLKGYDYADLVKDKKLLNQGMKAIKEAGLAVSWETLKQFLPLIINRIAKKHFDIEIPMP